MIGLDYSHASKFFSPSDLQDFATSNADVLATCCAGEKRYADSLGWLSVDEWANELTLRRVKDLATRYRALADTFVIIGVGGSNNAARSVTEALRPHGMRIIYAGNTLSAQALNLMLASLEGHDVVVDCIAKNFETLEPGSSFRLLRQWLVAKYGQEEAARRIVCCGTIGSSLNALATEQGYAFVPFATNVGGRYTALTAVHLLPLACAGVDIDTLAAGARQMEALCRKTPAAQNDALLYACARKLLWEKGYRIELLSFFEPRFRWFSKWWEQLFGESEGKCGSGLFPASAEYSEELHSLGQYVQDGTHQLFETFIDLVEPTDLDTLVLGPTDVADGFRYLDGADFWDINKASFSATREAHASTLPVLTLTVDRADERHFGMLFYFFAFSCYLSATLMGLNPFDQPGVEAYKQLMFKTLRRSQ